MILVLLNRFLKNTAHGIMRTLLRIFSTILHLLLHIKLFIMVLTWPKIQYPIKVTYIIEVQTINCLILIIDAELMGRHGYTRE